MTLCRHFGFCGGCQLQHLTPQAYRAHKQEMVRAALARAGLDNAEIMGPVGVPEKSRRRAVLKFAKVNGQGVAGFHGAASHEIVDMRECRVLRPALLNLAEVLRTALVPMLAEGEKAEVHATETETGLDLAFRWRRKLAPALAKALAAAIPGTARIVFNGEIVAEQAAPMVRLGGVSVTPPPHGFLQPTREGEAAIEARVLALCGGAKKIADLFAGAGTFTLALARRSRVHAVEQDEASLLALVRAERGASGLKPITVEKRDLFKSPLSPPELVEFGAVVLDPPRTGAGAQVRMLAASKVPSVTYVSCDASSFARDAAILACQGFKMGEVMAVDQFLYSGHIELVAGFTR